MLDTLAKLDEQDRENGLSATQGHTGGAAAGVNLQGQSVGGKSGGCC